MSPPPSNYIIQAFNTAIPAKIEYATTLRAYGDLKELISQKPNWSRSIFERSLLLSYNDNADIEQILSILSKDEFIDSASLLIEG